MWGRLKALLLLGSALVLALIRRALRRRDPVEGFHRAYGDEGIRGVTLAEHQELTRAGGCTGCGRCDEALRVRGRSTPRVAHFVLAGTRSLPDYDVAQDMIAGLGDEELRVAEAACPYQVPVVGLARLVRRHAARWS